MERSHPTATVWDLRQQLPGGLTETIVAHTHEGERQRQPASCPQCARVLQVQEHVRRTVEPMGGPVALERPYFSCRSCHVGLYPLDDALGLVAGCQQLDRQHAAAQLVTAVPDDTAQSLFDELTGMHCGSKRLHTVTNQVAEGLTVLDVAPARQEMERRIASVSPGRLRRPVLVLGMDGAHVPTRPESARGRRPGQGRSRAKRALGHGQWRDAQGCRFDLLDGDRIVHLRSWHQVQNEEHLGEALQQIKKAGLIPEEQVRLCVVCDGAAWIWKHVQGLFPQARQCSMMTTVPSTSRGSPKPTMTHRCRPSSGWKRP